MTDSSNDMTIDILQKRSNFGNNNDNNNKNTGTRDDDSSSKNNAISINLIKTELILPLFVTT